MTESGPGVTPAFMSSDETHPLYSDEQMTELDTERFFRHCLLRELEKIRDDLDEHITFYNYYGRNLSAETLTKLLRRLERSIEDYT